MLSKDENSDRFKIPPKIRDITPPKLFAFCSNKTNKVNIIELETKQDYAEFEGTQLSNGNIFVLSRKTVEIYLEYNCKERGSWSHVKEIPKTPYLVSLRHSYFENANMEIFDISNKGEIKKIYSLGQLNGGNNILSSITKINKSS